MALIVVETPASLDALVSTLAGVTSVAVDTEADSLHAYWHRTCLLQLTAGDDDYIVDPIAVNPSSLAPFFADPAIEKIMHAGENDVRVLKRDFAFAFCNVFDTMATARILGYPRWGLADLLRGAFAVELDKRFQRFDWAARPLPADAIRYAAADTHYLPALRAKLDAQLADQGREEEAREEFARIASITPPENGFNSDDFWRVRGAHELAPAARPVLRELHRLRDAEARRANRPPFKIMADATLIAIAQGTPATQARLEALAGVPPFTSRRYGRAILAAVQRGRGQPPIIAERTRPDEDVVARFEALRQWRNGRAAERKVEGDVIVPNSILRALAAAPPANRAALDAGGLLGPWKLRTYGDEIVGILGSFAT